MARRVVARLAAIAKAQPVVLTNAIRTSVLAFMAFGLKVSPVQLGAIMLAVEAWLAALVLFNVTPTVKAEANEWVAAVQARSDEQSNPTPTITVAGAEPVELEDAV